MVRVETIAESDVAADVALDPMSLRDEELRAELLRPWAHLWIARVGELGEDVGAFLSTWHVADEIHVLNLVTRADIRRRGIARALMNEALDYARRVGAVRVLLEVRRSNAPAIALYQSLGFDVFGERKRYYGDGEDALEMMLVLVPPGA
jgi:ribosomal-protein-alanine N-acetyltransferase